MRSPIAFLVILLSIAFAFGAFTYNRTVDGRGAAGTEANRFQEPSSVAYDKGLLYVADSFTDYVFVLNNSEIVKSIGGPGLNFDNLNRPRAIFVDNGEVFIADTNSGHGKIYRKTSSNLVAIGLQYGTEVTLPRGIAADNDTVYLVDSGLGMVKMYDRETLQAKDQWGEKGIGDNMLSNPGNIFLTDDKIYIADTDNNRIQVYTKNFTYLSSIGRGRGGITLSKPESVFVTNDRVYVTDTLNSRIVVFSLAGDPLETFGSEGTGQNEFSSPRSVFVADDKMYVADFGNQRVQIFSINDSADAEIENALASASSRVQLYEQLAAAGAKIDINGASDCGTTLDLAQQSISDHRIIDAQTQIAQAESEANASIGAIESALDFRLRSMTSVSRERLGELPESVGSDDRIRVGDMISQAEQDIDKKDYPAAVDLMLSIESELSRLGAAPVSDQTEQTNVSVNTSTIDRAALAESRMQKVTEQVRAVEALAMNYNISVDSAGVDALLTSARGKLVNNDNEGALATVAEAETEANALISSVENKLANIEKARVAIADSESQIKRVESSYSNSIIKPNLAEAEKSLADAKATEYSDPETSLSLANSAKESAISEGTKATNNNDLLVKGGIAGLFTLVGAVAIAAVVIFLVLKRRRRGL